MFPLKTLDEARFYLQKQYLDTYRDPFGYRYAVCLKTDNIPVGYVNVSSSESRDFGYGLQKDRVYKKYLEQDPVHFIENL